MDLRLESASIAGFSIAGGGNGVVTTKLSWSKAPRVQRYDRPRAHGTVDLTRFYGGRLYELAGLIYGLAESDAQARLDSFEQALALTGSSVSFSFLLAGRSEAEQSDVRVDGDLEYAFDSAERSVIRWAVTLFAEDPRRYSATLRTFSYDPSVGSSVTVTNGGTFQTPPIFVLDGPAVDPVITDGTSSIDLTGLTMAAGDQLQVDVASRAVTLNGLARPDLIVAASTAWFEVEPGNTDISVSGSGFSTGDSLLTVTFHDARI
jgi:hypothetical protein